MKTCILILSSLLLTSIVLIGQTHAQEAGDHSGYDPATVDTVAGKVVAVEIHIPRDGRHYGVHLQLKTQEEILPIRLGPFWYLDRQPTQIQEGDEIEVTGSRIILKKTSVLIASEVRRGDQILRLRDASGVPAWQGWRRVEARDRLPYGEW